MITTSDKMNSTRMQRAFLRRHKLCLLAAVSFAALSTTAASAQTIDAEDDNSTTTGDAIVVTGSRVKRDGFTATTPTTTMGTEMLERVAAPNIADAINQLPALRSALTPATSSSLSNAAGGNFLDMRGLGYLRTLTLIDGKRYVPTTTTGALNINLLPQALVSSVDVVTGGASAAYGSDAVAGVVNLNLNTELEGFKGNFQGGITDHNDHRNYFGSVAYGTSFDGGRGHFVIGAETRKNSGVGALSDREWGTAGAIQNPNYTASNGEPRYLLVGDARYANGSDGGVINSPSLLQGIQFADDGSAVPFTYGDNVSATRMDGGDGISTNGIRVLESPIERYSAFAHADYEVMPNVTIFGEFGYAYSDVETGSNLRVDQITIQADNAYLPASVAQVMADNGIDSFTMGRGFEDYARGLFDINSKTWQATAGLEAELGGGWSFDAYGAVGRTLVLTRYTDDRITDLWRQSIDAVFDPSTGSIVCRSTLTDPGNGCVPANFFGYGNVSDEAITWMNGTSIRDWDINQQVVAMTINGEPINTWAGPVSVAVGGEYRHQSVDVTSDELSLVNAFRIGNNKPWSASQSVKEGFVEAVVPLAADQLWAQNLDLNVAARITDYSSSGTVKTWKAGLNYTVNDSIRVRITQSRDIRAPGLDELFAQGNNFTATIDDPILGTTYTVRNLAVGNPDLVPEKGDTTTAGIVFTPTAIPRLRMSLDYYDITLNGAINSLSASEIVTRCYTDAPQVCSQITRSDTTGEITVIRTGPANVQKLETSGLDFQLAYSVPVGSANLDLNSLVTYVDKLNMVDADGVRHFAGNTEVTGTSGVGGVPHWRTNTSVTYSNNDYRFSVTGRYVGGGILTEEYNVDVERVSGRLYFDLSGEIAIDDTGDDRIALYGTIQNLLDNDPPLTQSGTARTIYDTIGRIYTAGVRFNF
ncbi:TonB-dependent receptor [Hyphococcus formosus]|uniref:TonB-dependent receptor domain-containing protein n=1 Tax=Hyphococcus formosus TaxID=3143534 RepID=UPI00398AE398